MEILIALFIFAIVAAITTTVLRSVLNTRESINNSMEELGELQIAMALMEQDIRQATNRDIQIGLSDTEPAFVGSADKVSFTHAGLVNPLMQFARSTLQRVSYYYHDGNLYRVTSPVLDPTQQTKPISKKILSKVEWIKFSFMGEQNTLHSTWPLRLNETKEEMIALPRAVKVYIKLKKQGEMNLLFPLFENTNKLS
jgi:general secretion pathway protein J